MRAHDWAGSPLGHPQQWPQSLRNMLGVILAAPIPMFIAWGPQRCLLYNDPYLEILGSKHPAALGQPLPQVWPEIWEDIAPLFEQTLAGTAVHREDQPSTIRRKGMDEQTWFTFSYTPLRDDAGRIGGLYCVLNETTGKVIGETARMEEMQRLYRLFEQAPGFMAVLRGPRHVYELANHAYLHLVGQRDLIGKPIRDALPEIETQQLSELMDRVYATGEPFVERQLPARFDRMLDGRLEERFVDIVFQPILSDSGNVTGIFIQGSDVTQQYAAQREARRLNRELADKILHLQKADRRNTFQLELADRLRPLSSPEDVIGAATDLLGRYLGLSRALFAEIDETTERFLIRRDWTKAGFSSVAGAERILDDFGPEVGAVLRAGQPLVIDDVLTDPRSARHATAFTAMHTRSHLAIPLIKGGKLVMALGLHRSEPYRWTEEDIVLAQDMAERTWSAAESARAQAELRESQAHFSTLFEQSAAGVCETDLDCRLVRVNDRYCELVGRKREQLLGMRMHEFTHPDDLPRNERLLDELIHTGRDFELEKRYLRPDGTPVWILIAVSRIRAGDGRRSNTLLGVVLDMTERRRAEEKLRESDRRKDEFLAMLAHELRNPLAPISAAAELLAMGSHDQKRVENTSKVIARQAGHMRALIDDLLDMSRVTRGLITLHKEALDLKDVVAEAIEQTRPLIDARGHELEVHFAPQSTEISGDKKRLVQVLANLLSNAAKYTPDGGRIVVWVAAQDGHVTVTVQDNGIGMTAEMVDSAFDLFTQGKRSADRTQGGLGIGLALVKSLVALHGGTVSATSDGPNQGSAFSVFLPRLDQLSLGLAAAEHEQLPRTKDESLEIMVVDDNEDAAQMLALFLADRGHVLHVEHNPLAALRRAQHLPLDVCLLDIGLPGMDGNELARQLRSLPNMRKTVLIAVSGYGQPQDREASLAAGIDYHFVKPVDTRKLVSLLRSVVASIK